MARDDSHCIHLLVPGFYMHPASVDASLHLSAVKAMSQQPDVPVGMSVFQGPIGHSAAVPGIASVDLDIRSQPLIWQGKVESTSPAPPADKAPVVLLNGLQTKPMGAQAAPVQPAVQVSFSGFCVARSITHLHMAIKCLIHGQILRTQILAKDYKSKSCCRMEGLTDAGMRLSLHPPLPELLQMPDQIACQMWSFSALMQQHIQGLSNKQCLG